MANDLNLSLILRAADKRFKSALGQARGQLQQVGGRAEDAGRRAQRGFGRRILDVSTGPLRRFSTGLAASPVA